MTGARFLSKGIEDGRIAVALPWLGLLSAIIGVVVSSRDHIFKLFVFPICSNRFSSSASTASSALSRYHHRTLDFLY